MRIIDEKGRIFGKINIIDFMILILLVSIFPFFYYAQKLFYNEAEVTPKPQNSLEITCIVYDITPDLLKKISEGDKEYDTQGNLTGEILKIGKMQKIARRINLGPGMLIKMENGIILKLRLNGIIKSNFFFYKNKQIFVDKSFEFKTSKYVLRIYPKVEEEKEIPAEKITVRVIASRLIPEVAQIISIGDKEYKIITEGKEDVLGEIISVKRVFSTKGLSASGFKNVELILSLMVSAEPGEIYYKGLPVKIGETFIFRTPRYNLECKVLEIFDNVKQP